MKTELNVAENLAQAAGDLSLELRSKLQVRIKPNEGPVTNADIAADKLICERLAQHFPDDLIVSEESFNSNFPIPTSSNKRVWFVDPIDGTSDYIRGGSDFSVMIGLAVGGHPVLGVVYQPAKNILWSGYLGKIPMAQRRQGSSTVALDLRSRPYPASGPIVAVSRYHPSQITRVILEHLQPQRVIPKGSIGLKMMLVAEGEADLYLTPTRKIKVWDTCAPEVIVTAAFGITRGVYGEKLTYTALAQHGMPIFTSSPAYAQTAQAELSRIFTERFS